MNKKRFSIRWCDCGKLHSFAEKDPDGRWFYAQKPGLIMCGRAIHQIIFAFPPDGFFRLRFIIRRKREEKTV